MMLRYGGILHCTRIFGLMGAFTEMLIIIGIRISNSHCIFLVICTMLVAIYATNTKRIVESVSPQWDFYNRSI
jgi:hypothetical protein